MPSMAGISHNLSVAPVILTLHVRLFLHIRNVVRSVCVGMAIVKLHSFLQSVVLVEILPREWTETNPT